ncbi:MAG: hypothetical protein R3A11_08435 [Bdellovibrionota bacterium]
MEKKIVKHLSIALLLMSSSVFAQDEPCPIQSKKPRAIDLHESINLESGFDIEATEGFERLGYLASYGIQGILKLTISPEPEQSAICSLHMMNSNIAITSSKCLEKIKNRQVYVTYQKGADFFSSLVTKVHRMHTASKLVFFEIKDENPFIFPEWDHRVDLTTPHQWTYQTMWEVMGYSSLYKGYRSFYEGCRIFSFSSDRSQISIDCKYSTDLAIGSIIIGEYCGKREIIGIKETETSGSTTYISYHAFAEEIIWAKNKLN